MDPRFLTFLVWLVPNIARWNTTALEIYPLCPGHLRMEQRKVLKRPFSRHRRQIMGLKFRRQKKRRSEDISDSPMRTQTAQNVEDRAAIAGNVLRLHRRPPARTGFPRGRMTQPGWISVSDLRRAGLLLALVGVSQTRGCLMCFSGRGCPINPLRNIVVLLNCLSKLKSCSGWAYKKKLN